MRRYRVVDVFAEQPLAGNPLTVVLDCDGLSTADMQAIARETNHSETTFVTAGQAVDGAWPVRIFTPARELPFAGHPTLGTAWVISHFHGVELPLELALGVGRVPVRAEGDTLWMTQPKPTFGPTVENIDAAAFLGLATGDVVGPCQVVSTGVPFLIVQLASLDAVRRARYQAAAVEGHAIAGHSNEVFLFCREGEPGSDADFHARMFAPGAGVPEDPATGSANGCLAAYLSHHQVLGSAAVDAVVEQGIEMSRPSRLHIRATPTPSRGLRVEVGGRVVPVAEGVFLS